MSDKPWITSLRGNTSSHWKNSPKAIPRKRETEIQHCLRQAPAQSAIVITEERRHLKSAQNITRREVHNMRATCFKCRKVIESGKIYSSQCCSTHYIVCWSCFWSAGDIKAVIICDKCSTEHVRENFQQMETSSRRRSKCDICDREKQPEYILPCKCKICLGCFYKEMFLMYVKDGETKRKQFFIGCTKHGVDKKLQSVERVYRLANRLDRTHDALACAGCEVQLEGKHNRGSENLDIQLVQNPRRKCKKHMYHLCIELPCKILLCVACMEDMAETTAFSTGLNDKGAFNIYCKCPCYNDKGTHIVSLCLLQDAASQINYLTACESNCCSSQCSQRAIARVHDCQHAFCLGCMQHILGTKKCKNGKLHKKRQFSNCGRYLCDVAIPCDQIIHCIREYSAVQTSALGQENEVLEEQFATPRITETVQESINDEDSSKAQKEQNTNKDRMTGKTNNETTSVTPVEEQIRYNMHRKTPDQEPVEMVDMGTEIVVTKTSQNKSNTGSESRTIEVEMEADELPQKRTFLKARATGYCNNYIAHYQKAFVEFRDCSHRLCIDCLRQRLRENKDRTVMVCGMHGCKKEIPVDQLDHYLMENEPAVCGNLRCNADSKSRMDIRWTCRKCKHKLCVICTSEQSTDINDKPRCMSATCQSSEHDPTTLSTGHLSSFRDQREILGIPNLGLTCYASCILQILGQTPDFKEYLHKYCHQNGQDHVDTLLKDLLENVNVGADGQFIINWLLMERLMHRIFSIDRSFRRFEENDCHSFIMTLFNALRKEDSQNETGTEEDLENISSDKKARVGNLRRQRAASGGKYTTTIGQDQCPAVLFESRLISKFTYKPCEHEEEVDDQLFRSILVPVQYDLLTLKEGVNMFFKGEEFPDNTLPCRSCNVSHEHTITTRVIKIAKAPKVLMLQLARFEEVQMAGSSKELRKTSHQVTFEKDLTLDQSVDGKELQYELYGVVIHTGSMLGGHYTSCVRKQQTNRWFYCSDSTVREIKEERIFQEWTLRNAYVLFYSRKT